MLQTQGQFGNSFMTPPSFDSNASYNMPAATNNHHHQEERRTYASNLNSSPPPSNSSYASYTPRATPRSPPVTPTKSRLSSASSPGSSTGSQVATLGSSLGSVSTTEKSLDFTHPTSGYAPEDLTITLEGRKVKIRGKRVETSRIGGRKTHNEFTKVFDLPSHVSPDTVKCYIQDGLTLHIVSNINDLQGAVHFLPVTKKW